MKDTSTETPEKKRGRGRPRGSRNTSSMHKAQLLLDTNAERFAELVLALADNDKVKLNSDSDVPYTVRLSAIKLGLDKSVANEKEKLDDEKNVKGAVGATIDNAPKIYRTAI